MAGLQQDAVDRIVGQWNAVRPDVDVSPISVIGRLSRLSRLVDRRLAENFGRFGIEAWMYDVLATLRRTGEPYELTAGELVRQTMVTTGAITNRVDRLEQRGLVERTRTEDRRKVVVRLTPPVWTSSTRSSASTCVPNERSLHLCRRASRPSSQLCCAQRSLGSATKPTPYGDQLAMNSQSSRLIPWMNGDRSMSGSPTAWRSGTCSNSSRNASVISLRARLAPRQKCGPPAP